MNDTENAGANKVTLNDLKAGEAGNLSSMSSSHPLCSRLSELGFQVGTPIQVVRKSLFGGPIQIKIRNSNFAIRRNEAELISVTKTVPTTYQ